MGQELRHGNGEGIAMKVDIMVPTLNREKKLKTCMDTLIPQLTVDVHAYICVSGIGEQRLYTKLYDTLDFVSIQKIRYDTTPGFWNTFLRKSKADAVLIIFDDCTVEPDCIAEAALCMEKNYPKFDGIIGLNLVNNPGESGIRANGTSSNYEFRLIGIPFCDKYFKKRRIYCPDYLKFWSEQEVCMFAESVGAFTHCQTAGINHFLPDFFGGVDTTHTEHRVGRLFRDNQTRKLRATKGYLWGRDFNLIWGRA